MTWDAKPAILQPLLLSLLQQQQQHLNGWRGGAVTTRVFVL